MTKELPFSKEKLDKILERYPTPFHIYEEKGIIENAKRFLKAFEWNKDFKEFFAVKATPNPFILKILKEVGFGADCSSLTELLLAEKTDITGEEIMFTSNNTPAEEYEKARELNAIINLDDISHISFLAEHGGIPNLISFRYNPGSRREGSFIMGNPSEVKYGFTKKQIFIGLKELDSKGVQRFGLHTFIASNQLDPQYFIDTAEMMFKLAVEVKERLNISLEFVNIGGGIGIPYHPEEEAVDLEFVGRGIKLKYDEIIKENNLHPLAVYMECGRMITGPYGYLVSKAIHKKEIYKKHIGLDASMNDLMRPGIYDAYHHITVMGKEEEAKAETYDVTGSLCESIDRFAVDRKLPKIDVGDTFVIHDTGAHGHAMGFNYNGKLRGGELLLREDGQVIEIRRAETVDDYFRTLDFEKFKKFKQ
ncbi:MAG: diaminopimelate decarboxylase [Halanaerobiales bacterium]|nr:diaminopimelate decarboxylase [Halanaerobiales bacterium]